MIFDVEQRLSLALLSILFLVCSSNLSAQTAISNAEINIQTARQSSEPEQKTEKSFDNILPKPADFIRKVEPESAKILANKRSAISQPSPLSENSDRFYNEHNREKLKNLELLYADEKSANYLRQSKKDLPDDAQNPPLKEGFQWRSAIRQSLLFLAVQHGYAFTQPKTREALKGKFFKDYAKSVKSLRGWDDGGRFFTNYVAHPLQGSFTGFIYVQNDPKGRKAEFGNSSEYWKSRLKAFAWTTAWSTQFEIGPISQASIGNVGLKGKQTWEDIIVTPTLGTAMLVTEDALDRYLIKSIERKFDNFYIRIFARMLLNPTRNFSNMLRLKTPWYRDRPIAH